MKKQRAKLFRNGGSQAVRLPKNCRFDSPEVVVYRQGRLVILEPSEEWSDEFRACLGALDHDIPRIKQRRIADSPIPFE